MLSKLDITFKDIAHSHALEDAIREVEEGATARIVCQRAHHILDSMSFTGT